VVSAPQAPALATASLVTRLPFGMSGVALVIFVHARTGPFGIAGLATGCYTLGFALAGPLLGRQVDRCRPWPVLLRPSAVCTVALLAGPGGSRRGADRP
jgi:MFS family permease